MVVVKGLGFDTKIGNRSERRDGKKDERRCAVGHTDAAEDIPTHVLKVALKTHVPISAHIILNAGVSTSASVPLSSSICVPVCAH